MRVNRLVRSILRILAALGVSITVIVLVLVLVYTQPTIRSRATAIPTAASPDALRNHVHFLCNSAFPRDSAHPVVLRHAADYIAKELSASGGRVAFQTFDARGSTYQNVVASFGPDSGPLFVMGAHYDSFGELPAADDNASGVAGLLELGRLLGSASLPVRVDLVAYCLEEPPFFGTAEMGSAVHARSLRASQAVVLGMVSLEMIGFFAPEQPWNNVLLETLYPNRGDFVMVVGRWEDRALVKFLKKSMRGASPLAVRSLVTLGLPAVDASDHRNYWSAGYFAAIVTDTAFIRNPNYHTSRDLPSTLDYGKMAEVVEAMYGVAMNLDEYVAGLPNPAIRGAVRSAARR